MDIKNRKVLVTGATGFIGSHLVQRLIKEGASVRALAHYRSDPNLNNLEYLSKNELDRVEILKGNIEDPYFVKHIVEGCEIVFHLAALIAIPYSYIAPSSYVATNIQGTLNVLEACRSEGVLRLIHTSTSECYGTALYTPIDESHLLQAQSPYSATKISADKLVESYYSSYSLPVITIRPFNTYGPRQSARAVIPTIIGQLLGDSKSIKLGSISPIRDLTYVQDTVNGFVCASVSENICGEVINLGTGNGISIGDLVGEIMNITGREKPIITDKQRTRPEKSEVYNLISNNIKAKQLLSWQPIISLDKGLGLTIEYYKDNLNLLKIINYGI